MKNYLGHSKKSVIVLSVLLSLLAAGVYMWAFWFQWDENYGITDTVSHLYFCNEFFANHQFNERIRIYPMFYFTIDVLYWLFRNWGIAVLLFAATWAFVTNILQIGLISYLSDYKNPYYSVFTGSLLSFIWPISTKMLSLFTTGIMGCAKVIRELYKTSGATAPVHNLTFLCVKPFAIICIWLLIAIIRERRRKALLVEVILLAVSIFLSVLAKPNFYQVFAPSTVLILFVWLFILRNIDFWRCLWIGIAFVPATGWVIAHMGVGGVALGVLPLDGVNIYNTDNTSVITILFRGIVYAILVSVSLLLTKKKINDSIQIGWSFYIVGTIEWLLLIEPADRYAHNMIWAYDIAMYILFTIIIAEANVLKTFFHGLLYYFLNVILLLHAASGIIVFIGLYLYRWLTYLNIQNYS
ncbi:hypothetical protein [Butyrivibrio proteoclasticus]|uniref:hypothetical protein n=1 Tax=Butyrivibrio proteoclasticus TaxID=43305 RepID=UPI00047A0310|nr:hypothetical protein [Butyrivibrio proteoclasticus]